MKCLEPQHMLGLRVMSKKGLDAYTRLSTNWETVIFMVLSALEGMAGICGQDGAFLSLMP